MELVVINSGSNGNAYILKSNNNKFCLLDCGIKFQNITSHEKFGGFTDLDFVFVTHEHKDHSLSMKDFEMSGCEVVSYENIKPEQRLEIGQWVLLPFAVNHNTLNYGVIIYDKHEKKTICYVTDFCEMPKIQNVDYWLYEINYDEFTVDKIIETQDISKIHVANNIKFHNSLENAIQYFATIKNIPELIVVCHISNMGGTKERIKKEMSQLCKNIEIATKNLIVEF